MPQYVNHRSFTKGEPRAILAGRKGGLNRRGCGWRSADYIRGYEAGARNARRHIRRWIDERDALPPGEDGRELSQADAITALASVKIALKARGLPTHDEGSR
jgi:hypothetical protein